MPPAATRLIVGLTRPFSPRRGAQQRAVQDENHNPFGRALARSPADLFSSRTLLAPQEEAGLETSLFGYFLGNATSKQRADLCAQRVNRNKK
jgi:hypothetical protein